MADNDPHEPPDVRGEEGGAAEAFEALRAEVAGLRGDLAGGTGGAPDYSPTLAAMAASLKAMEAHPALRLTPAAFDREARHVSEGIFQHGRREFMESVQRFDSAGARLERLAGRQLDRQEHHFQLGVTAAIGVALGIVIWVFFSGPMARALPASWVVPERMAAATLRLDRWEAGVRILQTADARHWAQVNEGEKLERNNRPALEACWKAAKKAAKDQRCTISVDADR